MNIPNWDNVSEYDLLVGFLRGAAEWAAALEGDDEN
jgi:hypothetical protein